MRGGRATRAETHPGSIFRGPVFPSRKSVHRPVNWTRSFWRSGREGDGTDSMFERQVRYFHDHGIGREPVGLDDDRPRFLLRFIEQRTELFERDFLIAEINRRRAAA